jgi:hypothetical protein
MLVSFADEPGTIARIMLQAALNGDRTKAEHAALPVSVEELALDVAACVAAGARATPKDANGWTLMSSTRSSSRSAKHAGCPSVFRPAPGELGAGTAD